MFSIMCGEVLCTHPRSVDVLSQPSTARGQPSLAKRLEFSLLSMPVTVLPCVHHVGSCVLLPPLVLASLTCSGASWCQWMRTSSAWRYQGTCADHRDLYASHNTLVVLTLILAVLLSPLLHQYPGGEVLCRLLFGASTAGLSWWPQGVLPSVGVLL